MRVLIIQFLPSYTDFLEHFGELLALVVCEGAKGLLSKANAGRLVDAGNTVLVIEHNLDVIKVADRLIDMGPEGGNGGGTVVVSGTPEQVADCPQSYTGKFLAPLLRRDRERQAQLDAQ